MRGKVRFISDTTLLAGITPAYAGKRDTRLNMNYSCKDHPRLCGEKFRRPSGLFSGHGSPPPMRGKET